MKLQIAIEKWFRNFRDENLVLSQFYLGKRPQKFILSNLVGFNTSSFRVVDFAERVNMRLRASMIIFSLLGEF